MGSEFFSRNSRRTAQRSTKNCTTKFAYNPYNELQQFDVVGNSPASVETQCREVGKKLLPAGTSRLDLIGQVPFIPFPEGVLDRTRQRSEAPPLDERPDTLVQLFFGQLPYKVADNVIIWLCDHLAESNVLYIERVMQDKSRKGCMQIFVDENDVDDITSALNKRVLFDATGIWHAQNDAQVEILEKHCSMDCNRFKGLPFRMMVAEKSTSTYVRRQKQISSRRSRSATPPPMPIEEEEAVAEEYVMEDPVLGGTVVEEPQACMCQQCLNSAPYSSFNNPTTSATPYWPNYGYYDASYYYGAPMPGVYGTY